MTTNCATPWCDFSMQICNLSQCYGGVMQKVLSFYEIYVSISNLEYKTVRLSLVFTLIMKAVHFPAKWRLLHASIFITLSVPTLIRKSAKITQFSSYQSFYIACHYFFVFLYIWYASPFNSAFDRFFRLSLRPSVTEIQVLDRAVSRPILANSHLFVSPC